jgi:Mitochondrial genome maintenance MGM101
MSFDDTQPESKPETDAKGMILKPENAPDYTGMATEPFSEEARRVLAECPNHDDVEVKPDGICYMPGVWYRRQLTKAFGAGAWALKPTGPARTVGNIIEWPGALYILGRWVAEAVGGQATSDWMNHADSIQGAKTDCLSKCCGHGLAMASELWDKTWRSAWMDRYCTTYQDNKGKTRYKLKQEREPHAANLMGSSAPVAEVSQGGSLNSTAASRKSPEPSPSSSATIDGQADTGEAAPQEVYQAIQAEMKRLHFKAPIAKDFLSRYGATKVSGLTAVQAAEALAILKAEAS